MWEAGVFALCAVLWLRSFHNTGDSCQSLESELCFDSGELGWSCVLFEKLRFKADLHVQIKASYCSGSSETLLLFSSGSTCAWDQIFVTRSRETTPKRLQWKKQWDISSPSNTSNAVFIENEKLQFSVCSECENGKGINEKWLLLPGTLTSTDTGKEALQWIVKFHRANSIFFPPS